MSKNLKFETRLQRRAKRLDAIPGRAQPVAAGETRDGIPVRCGTNAHGWPVHVYRANARLGDRCRCGEHQMEVSGQ